jgi:RES domain-containing protein
LRSSTGARQPECVSGGWRASGARDFDGGYGIHISRRTIEIADLPADWTVRETHTQTIGDRWLDSKAEVLLLVPSVIMPIANAPDRNVLINHRRAEAASINIVRVIPFTLDPRLFKP